MRLGPGQPPPQVGDLDQIEIFPDVGAVEIDLVDPVGQVVEGLAVQRLELVAMVGQVDGDAGGGREFLELAFQVDSDEAVSQNLQVVALVASPGTPVSRAKRLIRASFPCG